MTIELHCNSCGRLVKAPRSAAGKQGQCPYCGKSVYIPIPEEELEELQLAPEDATDRQREAALRAERLRIDRIIAQQKDTVDTEPSARPREASPRPAPQASTGGGGGGGIEEALVGYLTAMRNADLGEAESWLGVLQRSRNEARAMVERLAADQIPPPVMSGVPAAVYQGFLKQLRAQL